MQLTFLFRLVDAYSPETFFDWESGLCSRRWKRTLEKGNLRHEDLVHHGSKNLKDFSRRHGESCARASYINREFSEVHV